eukprot:TRINITY_DN38675_c0_g2_i2.p1 TRINITY_DN38675_c0_g2~~TRINITY_DN38675_c0_g2_i2.p1  ORF type:complete len:238 (+),score=63.29 TRINITY_DN38675_c0_g2_i2:61-774(+)
MERRKVRRKDAPLYVEDETEEFCETLKSGNLKKVEEMLENCEEADGRHWIQGPLDDSGRIALHYALQGPSESHLRLVRLLTANKADANAAGPDGVTPLHFAAQKSSKFAVRALLVARADNQKRTTDGRTTVDFAACNESPVEMFEVLGWPGQGPRKDPLAPPWEQGKGAKRDAASVAAAQDAAPGAAGDSQGAVQTAEQPAVLPGDDSSVSLTGPLFLTAIWFGVLAVVAHFVIQNV